MKPSMGSARRCSTPGRLGSAGWRCPRQTRCSKAPPPARAGRSTSSTNSVPRSVTSAAPSQSRNASRLRVTSGRAHLLGRSIPGRADQKTRNDRLLVHVQPTAPLNNHPHHRLLPSDGDRDAADTSRHCYTCSPFPGAIKNGTSMRRGPDCLSGSQTTAEISSLDTIARAETGINRPAPPPFSFVMARRRRWLAA